jgi:hypothetical protein
LSTYQKSIGKDRAIALAKTEWWKGLPARQIAKVGLLTQELCLPFDVLHGAVEEALGRPVWTQEFGTNFDGIVQELLGEKDAPTLQEIMDLIPAEKRIIVEVP